MLCAAACGGGSHAAPRSSTVAHRAQRHASATTAPVAHTLRFRQLYALGAPLRDPAFAVTGAGRFMLAGGLDAADTSSDEITDATAERVLGTGALPAAQHDAQGAFLDGSMYVFGGGDLTELDHILQISRVGAHVRTVGTLPHAQSDVAVTGTPTTAYIVGGYDGVDYLPTILAWRPGAAPRVVGRLPVGLRYAAVTMVGDDVLVIGGSTPNGASDAIYRFDPATGQVRQIGRLPQATTHGEAATLDGYVYLVGGRGDSLTGQTDRIWAIDPSSGRVRAAGRLPLPISDAGLLTIGGRILIVGGQSPTSTLAGVGALTPVAGG